jgi:hypothetical protein
MHGIPWSLVQRMLIDAPRLETTDGETNIQVESDNPDDFVNAINNMIN